MNVRHALVLALALLGGCTQPQVTQEPSVSVRELGNGNWRATWRFPEPVRGLRFERPAHFFRERRWTVVTPGYALARDAGSQVIVLDPAHAPAAEITVEFPVDTRRFPREYEFFHRFTDGSVAVYTGMFHAATLDGARVIRDVRVDGATASSEPDTAGTYAYVGDIVPVRAPHMTAVVDPGLPAWLAYEMEQRVASFFTVLGERSGHRLERRPLVLFNFVPGAIDGYEYRGGALHGLIHLSAVGDGWHDADPGAVRGMLRFIAHEAVHMWNTDLARFRPGTPPWLHEGTADALAERLLVAAGIAGPDAPAAAAARARAECIGISDWAPLSGTRADRAHYACGHLVAVWSERLLQTAAPPHDLFDLLGALVSGARARDGLYGEEDWFAALEALGAEPAAVADLRRFVRSRHADPAAAWRRALGPAESVTPETAYAE